MGGALAGKDLPCHHVADALPVLCEHLVPQLKLGVSFVKIEPRLR